jgi:hypothetical protein
VDPIASAVAKENVLAKGDMHPIGTILLKGAPLVCVSCGFCFVSYLFRDVPLV